MRIAIVSETEHKLMEESQQVTLLVVFFMLTLWAVSHVENVFIWLLWGVTWVALSGMALVRLNR